MSRLILLGVLIGTCQLSQGQCDTRGPISNPSPGVLNGIYVEEHIPTKKVVPYEYVREADVSWSKRVWRAIDLREKFNHPLYYPLDEMVPKDGFMAGWDWRKNNTRWSLWTIILNSVLCGELTVYSPYDPNWVDWNDGDQLKYPISSAQYGSSSNGNFFTDSVYRQFLKEGFFGYTDYTSPLISCASIQYPGEDSLDDFGSVVYYPRDYYWYMAEDIVQYRIKEDWFFDKERSVMDVRIVAICPVVYLRDADGMITGFKELFWLYFPECRYVFQNFYVQNRHNDAQRMSFDDLFWKRMFQSYIIKESNIYEREINSYKAGVDALLEAEKIKGEIVNFEHDLWSF